MEDAADEREKEKASGNDSFEGEQEHSIRKRNLEALHHEMDLATEKGKHRLRYAVKIKDTNMQWDLIAAGVEEGVIEFFKLEGKEATKMRGRSKITFAKKTKRLLKGIEESDGNEELASRATWLRTAANCHTKLANRLINLARTMKPSSNATVDADRQNVTGKTMKAYVDLATKCSTKKALTEEQKSTIRTNWKGKRRKKCKKTAPSDNTNETRWDDIFHEIQQFGTEAQELLELTKKCDLSNVIHSAKLTRYGEAHKRLAHNYFANAKGEVEKPSR